MHIGKMNTRTFKDETVAISALAFLPLKGANSTIMGQHHCIAVCSSKMQAQQSLTLRGRSILGGGSDIGTNILPRKAANIMTKGVCRCMALEFSMMRDQKSLTLR